jgi:hypothetical protein
LPTGDESNGSANEERQEGEEGSVQADLGAIKGISMQKLKVWVDDESDEEVSDTGR